MGDKNLEKQVEDIRQVLVQAQLGQDHIDFDGLCLFPEFKLPDKFKMPAIKEFDETGNPRSHVSLVISTLKPMDLCDELIAQLFQRTLTGNTLY